jgi:hypothetical protein
VTGPTAPRHRITSDLRSDWERPRVELTFAVWSSGMASEESIKNRSVESMRIVRDPAGEFSRGQVVSSVQAVPPAAKVPTAPAQSEVPAAAPRAGHD